MASDKVDTKFTSAYVQPPALKHGPLTKVFDNVYTVQGTADMVATLLSRTPIMPRP